MRPIGESRCHADDAVECLFPIDGSGRIGVLRCGIDASTREGGIFTVAAVSYGLDNAKKANREWDAALRGRTFHMTDLHARQNEFEGVSTDEADEIMKAVVGVVCKFSSITVGLSCSLSDMQGNMPRIAAQDITSQEILAIMRSPYGMMCHFCMATMGQMARGDHGIIYTLESGDDGQKGVIRYLDFVESHPQSKELLSLYSLRKKSIGSKEDIEGIFHSADLVAWEWGKHLSRSVRGKPMRKSFELIVEKDMAHFRHYESEEMAAHLEFYHKLLSATEKEQVEEAYLAWREAKKFFPMPSQIFPQPR